MCGIIFVKRKSGQSALKILKKRYYSQSTRGKRGYGYIAVKDGYVKGVERAKTESEIMAKLEKEDADEFLFHHRAPTSTPNYEGATHPIHISSDSLEFDYYMTHNGIISNRYPLKDEHEKKGFVYSTEFVEEKTEHTKVVFGDNTEISEVSEGKITTGFNDSESLGIELALFFEGKKNKIDVNGDIAFHAYQTDKEGKIINFFYGRNVGRPMVVEYVNHVKSKNKKRKTNEDLFILKSVGKGREVEVDKIFKLDYETKELSSREVLIGEVNRAWRNTNRSAGYNFPDKYTTPKFLPQSAGYLGQTAGDADDSDASKADDEIENIYALNYDNFDVDSYMEKGMLDSVRLGIEKRQKEIVEEMQEISYEKKVWTDTISSKETSIEHKEGAKLELEDINKKSDDLFNEYQNLDVQIMDMDNGYVPSVSVEKFLKG